MKYKMIVSDFDGTIYRSDYTIGEATKLAIDEYKAIGGKMVIATGRLFAAILPHAKALGLSGEIITYQGSGIFDIESGRQLIEFNISTADAAEILAALYDGDTEVVPMLFYKDTCYIMEECAASEEFAAIVGVRPVYTGMRLDEFVAANGVKPIKILALIDEDKSLEYANVLKDKFGERFNINRSASMLIEMVNRDASKGNAVKWIADKYGISREEIIAIGDAENDCSMIEYAGLGVAVANAMDSVKAIADCVADSNDEDGVARIILKYGVGGDNV